MNVTVMSRNEAIKYCHKAHDTKTVMISISDPYTTYTSAPFCSRSNNVLTIQRLYFSDVDASDCETDPITDYHARLIKKLLEQYPNTDIIVHCDAGVSRSAGVAAAILKAKTGDDSQIFDNYKYKPNMKCYRTVLTGLMMEEG